MVAVLAALMSIHARIRPLDKLFYFLLIAGLLTVEFRAMSKDREEARSTQNDFQAKENERLGRLLETERGNTKTLLDQENKNLSDFLKQDQAEFTKTISTLVSAHRQDDQAFTKMIGQQQQLFLGQRAFSEQFAGRLVPDTLPTPENACTRIMSPADKSDTVLIVGSNAMLTRGLPKTMLMLNDESVLSVDKVGNSQDVALGVEMRDKDGAIIFRIDKDGLVNPRGSFLVLHPDPSTLLLQDRYGRDFFKASLINSHTVVATGKIIYCGRVRPLGYEYMTNTCLNPANTPGSEGFTDHPGYSCPTPQ